MKITLNGAAITIEAALKLPDFLQLQGYAGNGFAVAINKQFIPQSQYDDTVINTGDAVEVVAPMQGG